MVGRGYWVIGLLGWYKTKFKLWYISNQGAAPLIQYILTYAKHPPNRQSHYYTGFSVDNTQLGTVARAYVIYICIHIAILSFLRASRSHQQYSNTTRISFRVTQLEILLPAKIIPYQRAKRSITSKKIRQIAFFYEF